MYGVSLLVSINSTVVNGTMTITANPSPRSIPVGLKKSAHSRKKRRYILSKRASFPLRYNVVNKMNIFIFTKFTSRHTDRLFKEFRKIIRIINTDLMSNLRHS